MLKPDGVPYKKLMINLPPQHGKTRTLVHFCNWILGINNKERIICASYNDGTAADFSRYVRDNIQKEAIEEEDIVYSDIFPTTRIKHGDASVGRWALEGQFFNYLGAGVGGSITSKGATVLIVDDPIKGAIEAFNDLYLEKNWTWYSSTLQSRVSAHGGEPIEIVMMTRWSALDICGKILADEDMSSDWYQLKLPACLNEETGEMLCPDMLSFKRFKDVEKIMNPMIFNPNYRQKPIQAIGALYKGLSTYDQVPRDENGREIWEAIKSYTDTADEGKDYLCSIIYGVFLRRAYVLDVYYTKSAMEITEPEMARRHNEYQVGFAKVESNNGGRGFARNVERIHFELYKKRLPISWFHQSKNKKARLFAGSSDVIRNVYFPTDWMIRWPEYANAMLTYTKEGQNEHDDAPDATTGVIETINDQVEAVAIENPF